MKKKSVNLISLGCSKNLVDSEKFLGQLSRRRFDIRHDDNRAANIVIINTCGFIGDAKQESIDTILSFVGLRTKGEIEDLIVMGCLSQRYREELAQEIPEVDAWFGVDEPQAILSRLKSRYDKDFAGRYLSTPSHYAYLKIAEGCDRTCSFCAIPAIRGRFRSVPLKQLVREATFLASNGVKELILVAQDLTYYGRDLSSRPMLAELVEALLEISQLQWIRLHYLYPVSFPYDIIPLMANEPRVCRYIDMPLQHISDPVLTSMRRGHDKAGLLALIERLRSDIPGLALRTTLMVGYPGETRQAYEELRDFVTEARFERLGVFAYSPEDGTRAYGMPDDVDNRIKQERADEIMHIQQRISYEINQGRIGSTMPVIIDRIEHDYMVGRTEFDSPEVDNEVILKKHDFEVAAGDMVHVLITDAGEYELGGEIMNAIGQP